MAAPTNFMSALDGLTNISYMDVQLLGLHDGLVHYAIRSNAKDEKKLKIFNTVVDFNKEQINVENVSKQLIFTSYGGLRNAKDKMSVYSALNYFRGPMLTVCGNELLDKTENNSLLQLKMSYHEPKDGFIIRETKNMGFPTSPTVFISQQKMISYIAINFNYENPAELSPSKKALALMATLKLMHYYYSFHLHLMPSNIIHLMPPGSPKEPLNVLEYAGEILMRPSCIVGGGNIVCTDLLDGKTMNTFLVVECDYQNIQQNTVEISIKDQFGVLQFGAQFDTREQCMEVHDSKISVFGTFDGNPRAHKLFGENVMFLKATSPYTQNHSPDTKVFEIHRSDDTALLAQIYLMKEWQVVKLCMTATLEVHSKALIVAHAALIGLFRLQLWKSMAKQFSSEYLFRKTLS